MHTIRRSRYFSLPPFFDFLRPVGPLLDEDQRGRDSNGGPLLAAVEGGKAYGRNAWNPCLAAQVPRKLRTAGCSNCDRGSNFLALTDPDLLDCPICFDNLTIPVFQCLNGHLACSSCCIKVRNKCPFSSTTCHDRCWPIEKIIESVKTSCQNQKYGCTEMLFRCKKHDHEDMRIYAPSSCPLPDCDFVRSSKELSLHFSTKHSGSAKCFCYNCSNPISLELQQKSVILQEEQEGTIFILNNGVQNLGNVIDVCYIAPISSKRGFSYDLLATNGGRSVKLKSSVEHIWGQVEHTTPKSFLMVPSDFFGSRGQLNLELHISRSPGVVHA